MSRSVHSGIRFASAERMGYRIRNYRGLLGVLVSLSDAGLTADNRTRTHSNIGIADYVRASAHSEYFSKNYFKNRNA